MLRLTKKLKRTLLSFLLFLVLFIFISGITGSWVVSTRLLYRFNFFIYGNLGKMVLTSIIVFGLLIRKRLKQLEKLPKIKTNIFYIVLSFILIPIFFLLGNTLLEQKFFNANILLSLATHGVLILIPTLLLLGIFGISFLVSFAKHFQKELLICLGISIGYDLAIFQVWKLWPIFSDGVLQSVRFLLSLTSSNVMVIQPRVLVVNKFAVSIEQACSGLDSLFIFSSLYLLITILDFKEFNKVKLICMAIPAAIGLYLVNILRVYLLVIIGAYISSDLAVNLFHTYLGMVLFIIFFFIFWKSFYVWMKK
ncbi:MAG: archaeosortase/exosortase family protein [Candidatus Microgenomates bacterium]